jgi:hypothetical protein
VVRTSRLQSAPPTLQQPPTELNISQCQSLFSLLEFIVFVGYELFVHWT